MGRTRALGDKRPQRSEEEITVPPSTPAPHRLCAMATSWPIDKRVSLACPPTLLRCALGTTMLRVKVGTAGEASPAL